MSRWLSTLAKPKTPSRSVRASHVIPVLPGALAKVLSKQPELEFEDNIHMRYTLTKEGDKIKLECGYYDVECDTKTGEVKIGIEMPFPWHYTYVEFKVKDPEAAWRFLSELNEVVKLFLEEEGHEE